MTIRQEWMHNTSRLNFDIYAHTKAHQMQKYLARESHSIDTVEKIVNLVQQDTVVRSLVGPLHTTNECCHANKSCLSSHYLIHQLQLAALAGENSERG